LLFAENAHFIDCFLEKNRKERKRTEKNRIRFSYSFVVSVVLDSFADNI